MEGEKEFLQNYNIEKYDRPSVTTDVAMLTVRARQTDNYRTDDRHSLSILLVKRGRHPYKGMWALPGGFLQRSESVEDCALRETVEETNVTPAALMPIGIFSDPGRDPRGWIISSAYVSVLGAEDIRQVGGDDAEDAKWFDISFDEKENEECELTLTNSDAVLHAQLHEKGSQFGRTDYDIKQSDLAFDHAKIIASAISAVRDQAKDANIVLDFLPEKFTLNEMQKVQEAITNVAVLSPNFRRKISGLVVETDEYRSGAGHRPAKLYRKKI